MTPMHAVIGADGDPVAAGDGADRPGGDPALHGRGAAADSRGAAAARAARRGLARGRRRRPARAPDGQLHRRGASQRRADRSLRRRRTRVTGLPRLRLPPRTRGGAPQHHRGVGPRHQDERGRVPARQHLPDLSRPQGLGRRGLLQRQGAGSLLSRPARPRCRRRIAGSTRDWGFGPEPFPDVHYYAPLRPDGVNLNTLRTNEALAANTEPLIWGLREVLQYAEVVLNRDDVDAKADAFIDFLAERWSAASTRTTCCAAGRSRCRASPTWRSSSARSSISWRRWARGARSGGRTTSRPSGRCATGSPTSPPARRGS